MEFIDLALPSRTLWGDRNTEGRTAYEVLKNKKFVPTGDQFEELFRFCKVERATGFLIPHLMITGRNGNRIFLPLEGYGVPIYSTEPTSSEAWAPRKYASRGLGLGYYRTCDWGDYDNLSAIIRGLHCEMHLGINPYRYSLRPVKY